MLSLYYQSNLNDLSSDFEIIETLINNLFYVKHRKVSLFT